MNRRASDGPIVRAAATEITIRASSVPAGAAASVDRQRAGQDRGELGHAPAPHDRGDRAGGHHPDPAASPRDEQDQARAAQDHRQDDQGQTCARQAPQPGLGASARITTRPPIDSAPATMPIGQGPPPEVALEVRLAPPPGGRHQEDGGDVGSRRDRQDADEDRGRVEPAGPRIAGRVARRHPARGDRAQGTAQEERRDHRREGEDGAEGRRRGRAARCTCGRRSRPRAG